jgi:hypothetical protein
MGLVKNASGCGKEAHFTSGEEWTFFVSTPPFPATQTPLNQATAVPFIGHTVTGLDNFPAVKCCKFCAYVWLGLLNVQR